MTFLDAEILALVVVPVLPLFAFVVLVRHWGVNSTALHERTLIALRDLLVALSVALLALTRLGILSLPNGSALVILANALLLVSLPSAYWLWLFWRGKFR